MESSSPLSEVFIILNAHAAKGRTFARRKAIERQFFSRGIPMRMVFTEQPLDAVEQARKATRSGKRLIVAAGGDGTVNEVVEGVVRASRELGLSFEHMPVIGVLPIGRGNDFAYSAGIPRNIASACALIAKGVWRAIDYGEVFGGRFPNGRCFVNGVGIGFEPLVNFVASDFKRIGGMLSYLAGFIKVLFNYPEAVKVVIESGEGSFVCDTQQISLCNGRRMGSAFIMGPQARLDDGLLDVVYANRPINGREILRYAMCFFSGSQLKTDRFSLFRTTSVKISAQTDALACHADGEEVSRGCRSIAVRLYGGGLKLIGNS